ncbi:MAG: rubrerythrin family protein [Firmicutes bacterium]|nr:rubrerythrin family protein [Bacillota bacterium]
MEMKGSRTEQNLKDAFAGESQARNKYTFFAKVAAKEGFEYVARVFEESADNERQHAKDEFKLLGGIGTTLENLKEAVAGEDHETESMYPEFARIAEEEGFKDAALLFRQIAKVEKEHRDRYKKLLEMVENGTLYKRENLVRWKCLKCGYIHEGTEPPPKCPCCKHPQGYFEPES